MKLTFLKLATLVLVLQLLGTSLALAQPVVAVDPVNPEAQRGATGNLACFDYYRFGSVTADLQPIIKTTIPNTEIAFVGTVVNENDYPVVDGTLVARIFKKDEVVFSQTDGNPVVDQFVIADDLVIPAKGSIPMEYTWYVPANAEGGEYYAAYFFLTNERYNLMGLSFTDDIVGNQANFTINNPNESTVAKLDKTSVKINGEDHRFASFPLRFSVDEEIIVTASISNPTKETKIIPLQWNQYAWDGRQEANRRNTETKLITLAPNETKELSYTVIGQLEPVTFVTATAEDNKTKSILNIRMVREGIEETRINFPSLTKFPLQKGETQTVFACAHSTNLPVVSGNTLTLSLKDKDGNIIHQYQYEGDISSAMSGFGSDFTPEKNYNLVTLEAALIRNGVEMERVAVVYDCNQIDPNSCLPETAEDESRGLLGEIIKYGMFTIVGLGLLGLVIGILLYLRRRGPNIVAMLALMIIGGGILLPSGVAEAAKTTQWMLATGTTPVLESYIYSEICVAGCGGGGGGGPLVQLTDTNLASANPSDTTTPTGQVAGTATAFKYIEIANLFQTSARIERSSNITDAGGTTLNDGATIPVGGRVLVVPRADQSTDITWFGVGESTDSPYGYWSNSTGQTCSSDFLTSNAGPYGTTHKHYVALKVTPTTPTITTSGTAGLSCNGDRSDCTVTSAGTINITVTWPATVSRFTYALDRDGTWGGPPDSDYVGTSGCVSGSPFKDPAARNPLCTFNLNPADSLSCFVTTPNYSLPISAMVITHSITATGVPNNPPAAPTFTGPATAPENSLVTFTVTGTDPDGDQIYYQFDWNGDGTPDAPRLPNSGFVNSGISQFPIRNLIPFGSYTYWARTVDSKGATSSWTSRPITFTAAPPVTATLTINSSAGPVNVNPGDTLNIVWSSTNAASCTLWGSDLPGGGGVVALSSSTAVTATAGGSDTYTLICDSAVDTVVVNVANQGPNAPQINGSFSGGVSSGSVGQSLPFIIRGTDPENDLLRYEIDWSNDGIREYVSPVTLSGLSITQSSSSAAAGTYVIRARTTNAAGGQPSAWTTHTVTIGAPPPPTATLQARVNGGGWDTSNQTVSPGDAVELQWISTNATSSGCSALSGAGFAAAGTSGTDVVTTPAPNASDVFTVSCTGLGGTITASITISTLDRPNFSQPNILPTLSAGFDPITGQYDSVTINFSTTNNGASVANPSTAAQYRVRMDRNNDGYDAGPQTGAITDPLPVSNTFNGSVVFNNIPFGPAKVEVTVDTTPPNPNGQVVESNESDNTTVYNFTGGTAIPPPDPGLSIIAAPALIRSGQTTDITWSTVASYPGLSCTVVGPGDINETTLSGTKATLALTAKSIYTLTCVEATTNTSWTKSAAVDVTTTVEEI